MEREVYAYTAAGLNGTYRDRPPYESCFGRMERMDTDQIPENWREVFLAHYASTGNITRSCIEAGVSYAHFRSSLNMDLDFSEAWEATEQSRTDQLVEAAWEQGVTGIQEPVYFEGEIVGYRRVLNWAATRFLLEAAEPARYDSRHRIISAVSRAQLEARRTELLDGIGDRARALLPPGYSDIIIESADVEPAEETG